VFNIHQRHPDDGEALARRIATFWYGTEEGVRWESENPARWEIHAGANNLKLYRTPTAGVWTLGYRYAPREPERLEALARVLAWMVRDVRVEVDRPGGGVYNDMGDRIGTYGEDKA
jgi:hypothetical protein